MTKEEALKKFEDLDWFLAIDDKYEYLFIKSSNYQDERIQFAKIIKSYKSFHKVGYKEIPRFITPQEHQLLTELFKCEGWFDE